jgi:DNA-binding IclR family transcriptional regulator
VVRALSILDLLLQHPDGMSLTDVSVRLQLNLSTAHRLIATLVGHGYIAQDSKTRHYKPGLGLIVAASCLFNDLGIVAVARPVMEALIQQFNETTHLAVMHDGESVDLLAIESTHHVRVCNTVGGRFPIHCSSTGKVLLAYVSDEEVEGIVRAKTLHRYTPETVTSLDRLLRELAQVREQGYAIDDEEYEVHTWCAAAPVRDRSQRVIAALGVSGLTWRLSNAKKDEIVKAVMAAAEDVSCSLGFIDSLKEVVHEDGMARLPMSGT